MYRFMYCKYNPQYSVAVSADQSGMVEYWSGPKNDYNFPKNVDWQHKTDTDLYDFAKVWFGRESCTNKDLDGKRCEL